MGRATRRTQGIVKRRRNALLNRPCSLSSSAACTRLEHVARHVDERSANWRTHTPLLACRVTQARTPSGTRTESWPSNTTPTSTLETRRPKRLSKLCPPPIQFCRIPRSGESSIAARSTRLGKSRLHESSYRDHAERASGRRYSRTGSQSGGWSDAEFGDIFNSVFGEGRQRDDDRPSHGQDERYTLSTSFLDAVNGATRRLTLPDGRTLEIKIPPGTTDGQVLRLRSLGGPGRNGAPAGDALIEVHVADASPFSSRRSGHSSGAAGHAGGGGSRRRR